VVLVISSAALAADPSVVTTSFHPTFPEPVFLIQKRPVLDMLVSGDSFALVVLRLYKNNVTPDEDSVFADFDEANFSGYAEEVPAFGAASIVGHKGKIVDGAAREFIHNGGATANTIYGYYVVDDATSKVLWAERFSAPQAVANNGDKITITLAFTANSEN